MKCRLRNDRKEDILIALAKIAVLIAATVVFYGLMTGIGYIVTQSEFIVFSHYAESPMMYYSKSGLAVFFLTALILAVLLAIAIPILWLFQGIKKVCSKQGRQAIKDFWFKCEE